MNIKNRRKKYFARTLYMHILYIYMCVVLCVCVYAYYTHTVNKVLIITFFCRRRQKDKIR